MTTSDPISGRQPQPVIGSAIVYAATNILGMAVAFGLPLTQEQTGATVTAVTSVTTLVALVLAWRASRKVTPLSNPRKVLPSGTVIPLVPATSRATAGAAHRADAMRETDGA